MKKTYIIPALEVVTLGNKALCQNLIIGSGMTDQTTGDGTDLAREERAEWDIWTNEEMYLEEEEEGYYY